MSIALEFPCDGCGARLRFEPGTDSLVCPQCGRQNPLFLTGAAPAELSYDLHAPDASGLRNETDQSVQCPSCAAVFTLPGIARSGACPFCRTAIVLERSERTHLRPQGVLPFKVTARDLPALFDDWFGRMQRWPGRRRLRGRPRLETPCPIYLPWWVFSVDFNVDYAAARGTALGDTGLMYGWQPCSGRMRLQLRDLQIPAGGSFAGGDLEQLTPWDLSAVRPYEPGALAGIAAEHPRLALEGALERMKPKAEFIARPRLRQEIGGDQQQFTRLHATATALSYSHVLLPVWSGRYRYKGRSYGFLVNGQTGEVQGEEPIEAGAPIERLGDRQRTLERAIILAIVFGIIAWFVYVLYAMLTTPGYNPPTYGTAGQTSP